MHGGPLDACVTMNAWFAIVSVPVREAAPAFEATENATVLSPTPLAPLVTVIHGSLLTAVHGQPAVVVTATVPGPPLAGTD